MTTQTTVPARRTSTVALWTTQVLLGAFLLIAAAGPKLLGERFAVQIFDEIGAGQWFRYLVGVLELAGAIGLVVPALTGLAALGLSALLVGATCTQLFVLGEPLYALTPAALAIVAGVLAYARRESTKSLLARLRR
ncbi:DoxX family protein [Amycolatopsis sacchari]|uniref:DoxX-like family protein n=1 Tax=Amycolatopsis sacchari TaxID=115433 RepID=A0A1I3MRI1_9PSEU|nr:DoxX family protein [Amycolatopsis sacchari]SFI99603.1 DoxX-like family protein [Amycolatopsis sacchari]